LAAYVIRSQLTFTVKFPLRSMYDIFFVSDKLMYKYRYNNPNKNKINHLELKFLTHFLHLLTTFPVWDVKSRNEILFSSACGSKVGNVHNVICKTGQKWIYICVFMMIDYDNHESCRGSLWSWSYGSWIYNYMCNQCLSPLMLWVRIPLKRGVLDTTLCDKLC
jgi:hypothetical protein